MKIISKPDITSWIHDCRCLTCDAQLELDYQDLKFRLEKQTGGDYGDYYSYDTDHYYIVCAVCGKQVYIDNNKVKIPFLLQEKVKKEYNESVKTNRY